MKKILTCLFLCALMLVPVLFGGCDSTEEELGTNSSANGPLTLTLYGITDDSTTPEAIQLVEDQFNTYTKNKYNTQIKLRLFKESEYDAKVAEAFKAVHDQIAAEEAAEEARREAQRIARQQGLTYVEETTEAPETLPAFIIDEETGKKLTVYPEAGENQMDIFLVRDYEQFKEYILSEDIASLDESLNNSCKLLKSYIYPTFLTAAKDNGLTYAIPNNNIIGEYEYLFLNKEMVDKYSYYPTDLTTLASLLDYLETLKKYEPEFTPFAGDITAPIELITEGESYLGIYNAELATPGVKTSFKPAENAPKNLLTNGDYLNWIEAYEKLTVKELIDVDADLNGKVGAKIVKGDCTISPTYAEEYGLYKTDEKTGLPYYTDENGVEYYVSVYKAPVATNANMYNSMFCVSAHTANVEKCMNILLEINTNTAIRNLFQFGVEGVNYEISEVTGKIHMLNNTYSMNPAYTGNILILDQCEDWDKEMIRLSNDNWQLIKNHNLESVISPLLGFYFNPKEIPEYIPPENEDEPSTLFVDKLYSDCLLEIEAKSLEAKKEIEAFDEQLDEDGKVVTPFKTFVSSLGLLMNSETYVAAVTDPWGAYSIAPVYNAWHAIQFK
ncbi:MAG: hypothetical protein E7655_02105 [Ruminococcaceae bacterium]|nr:hypothetical protein [Oscillospiraceae bacterium]